MSKRTEAFVKELARRLTHKRDVGLDNEYTWLVQRISVAVHSANGRLLGKFARHMAADAGF